MRLFQIIVLIASFFALSPSAQAGNGVQVGLGTIVSFSSGKCMDLAGNWLSSGVGINQWSCTGSGSQNFNFFPWNGNHLIMSQSGMCLDSKADIDGVQISQQSCNYSQTQLFKIKPNSDGTFALQTQSGRCVDVFGVSPDNGATIGVWSCHGGANQKFKGTAVVISEAAFSSSIISRHSGKCVDLSAANSGAPVQQWDCWGGQNQTFDFISNIDGSYRIRALHSGLCLDQGNSQNGRQLTQNNCADVVSQKFFLQQGSDNSFEILASNRSSCIDVFGFSGDNGGAIGTWQCWGGVNQKFNIQGFKSSGLKASQLAVLVNDNDPNSVETAAYYKQKRNIPESNIIHLRFPVKNELSRAEFDTIKATIDASLGDNIQAIAIAWTQPSRVDCNSITSAITKGYSPMCSNTCGSEAFSPYYNANSQAPYRDFRIRPSMMLAGYSLQEVKALIDRGVASDRTYPVGNAEILNTSDSTRSIRVTLYNRTKLGTALHPNVNVEIKNADYLSGTTNTLFYFAGSAYVQQIESNSFPVGAVADTLTSYSGILEGAGQMSILEFTQKGATGSFGTVSEPCASSKKFPDPELMIKYYTRGDTLIEAYWKSVAITFQGLFIGEPLANPWMK